MKKLLFLISLWLCVTTAGAQQNERDLYSVAFYNLENLFDTIHDAGKNDLEFLPSGSYAWTAEKYEAKLKNLAKVLSEVSRDRVPEGPAVIGVAEAENNRVLTDLVSQPAISTINSCITKVRINEALIAPYFMIRNNSPLPIPNWCFPLLLRGTLCT